METAAAVEKPGKFFHSSLQNACWRFAQFPQARRRLTNNKTKKQKPDTSLATKTGHFHLLPTRFLLTGLTGSVPLFLSHARRVARRRPPPGRHTEPVV